MNGRALYDAFTETAARHPDQAAFVFLDAALRPTSYTFRQLFDAVESIADNMALQGLGHREAPLGVLLRSQQDQTLHYLAALRAGAVPAILTPPNPKLNPAYYNATMAGVVGRARFSAVVTDIEGVDLHVPLLEPHSIEPLDDLDIAARGEGSVLDAAAFLQFSSGTTGIKRGVVVTHEAALAQMRAYGDALDLNGGDRILSWLPLYHDMGFIACLNLPLFAGLTTVVIDPIDWVTRPSLFPRAASDHDATLSWNPNFAYSFMAQRIKEGDLVDVDLSSLRGLVNCSEPVTFASQRQFLDRFREYGLRGEVFKGCYAMAETTFALTHGDDAANVGLDEIGPTTAARSGAEEPFVSVGRALTGVELVVADETGRSLGDREIGELQVRSPFNFSGYFNDPEATRDAFTGPWYRTGDLGYRVGDDFYVSGRSKDILIVGGVNVFPNDIEDLAGAVNGIRAGRVAVFSRFDPRAQTERVLVLAESDREGAAAREVIIEVRQRILAGFQIANFEVHLVPPEWLVKSSSGKMARSASRDKWEAEVAAPNLPAPGI